MDSRSSKVNRFAFFLSSAEIPLRRVTRRMLADHNSTRAVEILDEPEPDLIIDKQRLQVSRRVTSAHLLLRDSMEPGIGGCQWVARGPSLVNMYNHFPLYPRIIQVT